MSAKEIWEELGVIGKMTLLSDNDYMTVYVDEASQMFYRSKSVGEGGPIEKWPNADSVIDVSTGKILNTWSTPERVGWYQSNSGELFQWSGTEWIGKRPAEPDSELEYLG